MHDERAVILARYAMRAAGALGLDEAELARVLGCGPDAVEQLKRGERTIAPASAAGRRAQLLIRLYRSLDERVDGDGQRRLAWMRQPDEALRAVPRSLLSTPGGLERLALHVDGEPAHC